MSLVRCHSPMFEDQLIETFSYFQHFCQVSLRHERYIYTSFGLKVYRYINDTPHLFPPILCTTFPYKAFYLVSKKEFRTRLCMPRPRAVVKENFIRSFVFFHCFIPFSYLKFFWFLFLPSVPLYIPH